MGTGRASSRGGGEWALTYRCVGTEDEAHRAWEAVHRLLREAVERTAPAGRASDGEPSEPAPGGSALPLSPPPRGAEPPDGPLGRGTHRRGEAGARGLL